MTTKIFANIRILKISSKHICRNQICKHLFLNCLLLLKVSQILADASFLRLFAKYSPAATIYNTDYQVYTKSFNSKFRKPARFSKEKRFCERVLIELFKEAKCNLLIINALSTCRFFASDFTSMSKSTYPSELKRPLQPSV